MLFCIRLSKSSIVDKGVIMRQLKVKAAPLDRTIGNPTNAATRRRALLGGFFVMLMGRKAEGSNWPLSPVTWAVPFAPGGNGDTFARSVAARAGVLLGQPVLVDNRTGAGGNLAAAAVARAEPDGYSLLVGYTGHTYATDIYPNAGFDLGRDFAPISALARAPLALAVNRSRFGGSTLSDFLDVARLKPGSIEIGTSGLGSLPHLAVELLQRRTGIQLLHVPYRGGAPSFQDLLAGQVSAMIGPVGLFAGHAVGGAIRVLAIASRRREVLMPDVPTFGESGVEDFRISQWFGLFAPIKTPGPVLDRIHAVVQSILATEDIKRLWVEQAARVELESRADFSRFVSQEISRWSHIAAQANLKLD